VMKVMLVKSSVEAARMVHGAQIWPVKPWDSGWQGKRITRSRECCTKTALIDLAKALGNRDLG
jgi:hypothetical protein